MSIYDDVLEQDEDEEEAICSTCEYPEDDCECCGGCGEYPCDECDVCSYCRSNCECCSDCQNYPCRCCYECYDYPCTCSSGMGCYIDTPPWVKRGISVCATSPMNHWENVWDVDVSTDVVQAAADYYVLEALSHGIPNRPEPTQNRILLRNFLGGDGYNKWEDPQYLSNRNILLQEALEQVKAEAKEYLEQLVERLAHTFSEYAHMAISGELRHHRAIGGSVLSGDRETAWAGWKQVFEKVGVEALKDAAAIFRDFDESGYGGDLWAQCAERLYEYLSGAPHMSAHIFVDRVFNLEHNGGCFLDKVCWGCQNDMNWAFHELKDKILNSHAADIPRWNMMTCANSPHVKRLWDRYWMLSNRHRVSLGQEPFDNPRGKGLIKICKFCYGHKDKGHFITCRAIFNKSNFLGSGGMYIDMFEDNLATYDIEEYRYLVDGNGRFLEDPVMCLEFSWDTTYGSTAHPSIKVTAPLSQLMDVKIPTKEDNTYTFIDLYIHGETKTKYGDYNHQYLLYRSAVQKGRWDTSLDTLGKLAAKNVMLTAGFATAVKILKMSAQKVGV